MLIGVAIIMYVRTVPIVVGTAIHSFVFVMALQTMQRHP